ncbi:helix-turn-helix domain-containing protein, partial [Escherichia coli]
MSKNRILLRQDIGDFLRAARRGKSLTGLQLGKMLHISQQQISRYERGETSISIETLDVLLKGLDMDWSDFFFKVMANYSAEIAELK